ncbi:MAG TPA: DUF4142 domain-containing protein [Verrucomicrobiales bacterium]|nr:DUF4142 domain-containing protein [Verrucomicrobiales bacterium]
MKPFILSLPASIVLMLHAPLAAAQTPIRGQLPPAPVDTPQLFIPGQSPSPSANTNLVIPAETKKEIPARNFLADVNSANLAELRLARLAAARSQDPAVRAMAQSMIKENQTESRNLARLTGAAGIVLPDQSAAIDARFTTLSGAEFDTAFLREVQRLRSAKVARFEAARRSGANPELRSYINTALPLLQADARKVTIPGMTGALPSATPGTLPSPGGSLSNVAGGALPTMTPGTLPSPAGGNLPNPTGGALPSATPGTIPSPAAGNLPNPAGGALPGVTRGTLPSPAGGNLPSPIGGAPPSATPGTPPAPGGTAPSMPSPSVKPAAVPRKR